MARFKLLLLASYLLISATCSSTNATERHLLEYSIAYEDLGVAIRYQQSWVDYPGYADRNAWKEKVDAEIGEIIIRNGEKVLNHVWKPDLASDYLAFKRTGEIRTGRANHRALQALTLAELVEGKGRFMDAIIDGVWFLCETSWIHSAHLNFQKDRSGLPDRNEPTIELVVADIGAQMAWTHYFFKEEFEKVSPLINKRIVEEVNKNLINPYFARDDYWWMGFSGQQVNNWNPWINYNVLQALMLMEENPERIQQGIWKLMKSTDSFFSMYHEDGACDEGPTYWSGAAGYALKFLDLLGKVTSNRINIFDKPLLHNMAQYIYRVHIGGNYFVNFADSSPKVNPNPGILYQYGKRIGDSKMMQFAALMAQQNQSFKDGVNGYFASALDELFMYKEIVRHPQGEPLIGGYWFKDTQICVTRDREGQTNGFFFAAKGGHNQESHNHNDVGSCILYYNNSPLLIDAGVGTYTRQTFGPERYTIWTMQSGYHNLPTINGMEQKNGKEFAAHSQQYKAASRSVSYQVNIAQAYPKEANVDSWIRNYTLNKGKDFTITDAWQLASFQNPSVLNLMTCCEVIIDDNKDIILTNETGRFKLEYNKKLLNPAVDAIELTDPKLIKAWKEKKLARIRLTIQSQATSGRSKLVIKKL
ncbi:heparinase II/III family protein [Bacteroides sp.]|uniref:heparinase II/III domain-containing protein n=1 Tax=Bacteroides sp. TaxID=29523 RepID=UPI002610E431|nr:heparinase II/III family protein [Bacteroides sp.]